MARRPSGARKYVRISVVAERLEVHPQTLRLYEREGLVTPVRSAGNTRLYDEMAIRRLETILALTRDMGVNLAGVEVILSLKEQLEQLQIELDRLARGLERSGASGANLVDRGQALVKRDSGPLAALRQRRGPRE